MTTTFLLCASSSLEEGTGGYNEQAESAWFSADEVEGRLNTLRIDGSRLIDEEGRTLLLRGVNLGGSSKAPMVPDGATWRREGFFDHRSVSFVGRPFPLEEAERHLERLRRWGFNCLRFLATWEAIEHAGPGQYDQAYLDYLQAVLEVAGRFGFLLFVDPHQDVWSRFSGGDGAPGWTLEAVGFDLSRLDQTGAAVTHQALQDRYPWLVWPTNAEKLAASTMFTLFFAGNDFAPRTRIEGEPAQEYLQRHYIQSVCQVAARCRGMAHVLGYDTMNEPGQGWIGAEDLRQVSGVLRKGASPSPWQSILLGAGFPQEVEEWAEGRSLPRRKGARRVNAEGVRVWREGFDCPWKANGVWDLDAVGRPRLLAPGYFARIGDRPVHFTEDYYKPFANRFAQAIRQVHPQALIFLETFTEGRDELEWGPEDAPEVVFAPHWYDIAILVTQHFTPWAAIDIFKKRVVLGPWAVRRSIAGQLARYQETTRRQMGGIPVLFGEIGIPLSLDNGRAYASGCFRQQEQAADRSLRAVEDTLAHCTVWNYTADNRNQHGDQWNEEDFSLFSLDQQKDPADLDSGGRALDAFIRPYPKAVAGEAISLRFDYRRHRLLFTFRHDPAVTSPTEIFLPRRHFPSGALIQVSDGRWEEDQEGQLLRYWPGREQMIHTLRVAPAVAR